jgi:hypothetical protein
MNRTTSARYRAFDNMFKAANIKLARVWRETSYKSIFDLARFESKRDGPYSSEAKAYWSSMTLRKGVLYNAPEKMGAVKEIIERFPNKK